MPHKSMLFVVNPCAGQKRVGRKLSEILQIFNEAGYMPTVATTSYAGHARDIAREYASQHTLIVCAGGDGTLNETVDGVMESGVDVPIGYIPCGTTNDLASSLGLSRDLEHAAKDILAGVPHPMDIGTFNGRHFVYTASFGAFTNVSYDTPQNYKNALGHLAYLLEGIKNLSQLKAIHAEIHTDEGDFDDDFIFGSISNTTSLAGLMTLDKSIVKLDDGRFELFLVRIPHNAIELSQILIGIAQQKYEGLLTLANVKHIEVKTAEPVEWTLDGEYEKGGLNSQIDVLPGVVRIIVPQKTEE